MQFYSGPIQLICVVTDNPVLDWIMSVASFVAEVF